MTNFEFYADEIKAADYDFGFKKDGGFVNCLKITCGSCIFYEGSKGCMKEKIEWLYSEHKEQPKLTQNEHKLCEILKEGYIVRDKSGSLYSNIEKPFKSDSKSYWDIHGEYWYINNLILNDCKFSFITWQDNEPWAVSDLLKLEVMNND